MVTSDSTAKTEEATKPAAFWGYSPTIMIIDRLHVFPTHLSQSLLMARRTPYYGQY